MQLSPKVGLPRVTIIVPSTCERARWDALGRAIDSLLNGQAGLAHVLVVVNGNRFDPALLATLRERRDIEVHYREQGSLPAALRFGRSLVGTEFYGFLDDDDEYMPGAIEARLKPMIEDESLDCVATNGFRQSATQRTVAIAHVAEVMADPLDSLNTACWLASCGGLFRSRTIGIEYFDPDMSHIEWTALAFKVAASRRVAFLDVPTFVIHKSPQSLSRTARYRQGVASALEKLEPLELPLKTKRKLRRKVSAAHLSAADSYLAQGEAAPAWQHLRKSLNPFTWAHLRTFLKLVKVGLAGSKSSQRT